MSFLQVYYHKGRGTQADALHAKTAIGLLGAWNI